MMKLIILYIKLYKRYYHLINVIKRKISYIRGRMESEKDNYQREVLNIQLRTLDMLILGIKEDDFDDLR